MSFKEFLIDNYIWILVVVLLTIVTIIGFLVDKKKNGAKNAVANASMTPNLGQVGANNPQQLSDINQIPSPGFNNNMGVVQPVPINSQPLMNQSNGNIVMPNNNQIVSTVSQTVPQPVNESSNLNGGFVYQPLADQTPQVAPQPIPTQMPNVVPEPIPNVPSNNMQPSMVGQLNFQSNMNQEPQLQVIPQQIEQPQQIQQPQQMQQPPQINVIPTTVPTTPINQQPNMMNNNINNGTFNQANMYQNSASQQMMGPANNVQSPMQQPNVPVNNTPNVIPNNNASPVSFVFGPQNGGQN